MTNDDKIREAVSQYLADRRKSRAALCAAMGFCDAYLDEFMRGGLCPQAALNVAKHLGMPGELVTGARKRLRDHRAMVCKRTSELARKRSRIKKPTVPQDLIHYPSPHPREAQAWL